MNVPNQNILTSTKRSTSKPSEEDDDQSMGNGLSGSE